jgi:pimeloyl-ACP methyl ester carboxylesterase
MSGINSASGEGAIFELEPSRLGFTCDRFHYFSYAGPGDGQPQGDAACPKREGAPYEPRDTQRPFEEQVRLLAEQVAPLDPPVTVLAHSQAAWVAWHAAADGLLEDVEHLVLVGPFPSARSGSRRRTEPAPGGWAATSSASSNPPPSWSTSTSRWMPR